VTVTTVLAKATLGDVTHIEIKLSTSTKVAMDTGTILIMALLIMTTLIAPNKGEVTYTGEVTSN
jgi:hypothetical protein